VSAAQDVNLMQAARRIAQMPIGLAAEMLKVQVDELGVFGIGREVMRCVWFIRTQAPCSALDLFG